MKKMMLFLVFLFVALPAFASNITIEDGNYRTNETGIGQGAEDQEIEPGMTNDQSWDLEGFFLENNMLSMIGGFDFQAGQSGYASGDIFVSVDDVPQYGDFHRGGANGSELQGDSGTYGYEYVLDLDFSSMTYSVLGLSNNTVLQTAYYQQNEGSSPWKYVSGGVTTAYGGSFSFTSGLSNDNLMGRGAVVPEPTTMVLLDSGLIGLAFYRRKMKK